MMASRWGGNSKFRQDPTNDSLASENRYLRGRLREVEEQLRQANIRLGVNRLWKSEEEEERARLNLWRTPSPEEERSPREISRKRMSGSLEDMVAQVVDGGKKRRVGGEFDPEGVRGKGVPRMVKVGGVRWEEGIGGVEVALREAGVEFCDGTKWLVGEEELKKRRERGSLASTVVVRVRGEGLVGDLCCAGLWVGGYWYSVKRFVVVQPKRRVARWLGVLEKMSGRIEDMGEKLAEETMRQVEESGLGKEDVREGRLLATLKGLGERLGRVENVVKAVGRDNARREVDMGKRREERMLEKERLVAEEREIEDEMDREAGEFFKASSEEFKRVGKISKGGGVDFGFKPEGSWLFQK